MILQVHDELVLECPENEVDSTRVVVQKAMESAYSISIPLTTEAKWGSNWDELSNPE